MHSSREAFLITDKLNSKCAKQLTPCVIPDFRRYVNKVFALLEYYEALTDLSGSQSLSSSKSREDGTDKLSRNAGN